MLGRKPNVKSGAFAERMRRISETPAVTPKEPAQARTSQEAQRKPSLRAGTLTFMSGEQVDVVVSNLSVTGARVHLARNTYLPDRVMLTEPLQGIRKWGYVVRQSAKAADVAFVGANRAAG